MYPQQLGQYPTQPPYPAQPQYPPQTGYYQYPAYPPTPEKRKKLLVIGVPIIAAVVIVTIILAAFFWIPEEKKEDTARVTFPADIKVYCEDMNDTGAMPGEPIFSIEVVGGSEIKWAEWKVKVGVDGLRGMVDASTASTETDIGEFAIFTVSDTDVDNDGTNDFVKGALPVISIYKLDGTPTQISGLKPITPRG
jgi:hypothetical protein